MSTNATATVSCDVKDLLLAPQGKRRMEWAFQSMPVLQNIRKQFIKSQPFEGIRVGVCLSVTAQTANLLVTLRDGGASVAVCGGDVVQDDVAAALVKFYSIPVYAVDAADDAVRAQHLATVASLRPQLLIEERGRFSSLFHAGNNDGAETLGVVEANGVGPLKALARQGTLRYPVVAANESSVRRMFDNRYGIGQSALDAIVRLTNLLLAGMTIVVAGYGWRGRGIAARARGMGANVVVTEVDPGRAVEAALEGCRVMPMNEASAIGDVFVTATGNRNVLGRDQFERLKDGAILCNAGNSEGEIDIESLARMANSRHEVREQVEEFKMRDGRRAYLLGGGRYMNIAGNTQPASAVDISFAIEALSLEHVLRQHSTLEKRVYPVSESIDRQVARMKLDAMSIGIDKLTIEQEEFLAAWSEGN